jgi:hypothetical protein
MSTRTEVLNDGSIHTYVEALCAGDVSGFPRTCMMRRCVVSMGFAPGVPAVFNYSPRQRNLSGRVSTLSFGMVGALMISSS